MPLSRPDYLTEVDKVEGNIYCNHDYTGENHIAMHKHTKAQFLYAEGGIVHVITEDESYFLPARHYMWIPAGKPHSIIFNSLDVMMRNLYFPKVEGEDDFYERIAIYPVNELLLEMLFFTTRWKGQIAKENITAYSFISAMKNILPNISVHSLPLGLPYPKTERLLKVAKYMNKNLHEQLTFPEIAQKFGFSERTLSRTFQQEVKMSFIQFLTIQRMMRALQLLLDEKKTVNETAYAVGYNSLPTFSNTFSKIVGVRPSEYVKLKGVLKRDI